MYTISASSLMMKTLFDVSAKASINALVDACNAD